MTPLEYLNYLYLSFRYPQFRDFISGGFGILERYRRNQTYWNRHLLLSKNFIQKSLANLAPTKIAVLGAGRLLDLDLPLLTRLAPIVTLFDSDPGAKDWWKKHHSKPSAQSTHVVTYEIKDVTGIMQAWTQRLSAAAKSSNLNYSSVLSECTRIVSDSSCCNFLDTYDVVISLNLLSQIPVYWEDRCRAILSSRVDCENDLHFKDFVTRSSRILEEEHLALLLKPPKKRIILLTDRYFFYYKRDTPDWQTEEALSMPLREKLASLGIKVLHRDSWLWHVAPQGVEFEDHGAIHQVEAFCFDYPP